MLGIYLMLGGQGEEWAGEVGSGALFWVTRQLRREIRRRVPQGRRRLAPGAGSETEGLATWEADCVSRLPTGEPDRLRASDRPKIKRRRNNARHLRGHASTNGSFLV